ncbi:helix-turn-helix domain-containing protein [Amycolatopsis anabasis]|uniref:helix-turn-helix domain-containing protein n=1 Tax=Amycolatopsis anabasis TaxID=1840409 RepID=UPI00131AF7CF|nr:helix-turn-helix transcriptional regulator [Amycolatopsis anabasis]
MVESFGEALRRLRGSADISQRELARRAYVSQTTLSRYESDRQTVDPSTADKLDELLGADGALRALLNPKTASTTVLNPDDFGRLAYVAERPRAVDSSALGSLAAVLAESRRMEDTLGARAVLEPALGYFQLLECLVVDARGPLRPSVVSLAAQWAQFVGWLHAATEQSSASCRWLDRATEWALEVSDSSMVATTLSLKGYNAWKVGQLGPMLGLSEAAQRSDRVSPGLRAMAAQQEARAHALLGEADATDRKLDEATDLAASIVPEDEPPWVYFYGPDFLQMQRGRAYRYLGRYQEAANLLAAGLDALPPEQRDAEWITSYRNDLGAVQSAL